MRRRGRGRIGRLDELAAKGIWAGGVELAQFVRRTSEMYTRTRRSLYVVARGLCAVVV